MRYELRLLRLIRPRACVAKYLGQLPKIQRPILHNPLILHESQYGIRVAFLISPKGVPRWR